MDPILLEISGVEVPYFFGLSAKITFEDKFGKNAPESLRETIEMHYINYQEGCRLRKSSVHLTLDEFVDLLDKDWKANLDIITNALKTFSEGKK